MLSVASLLGQTAKGGNGYDYNNKQLLKNNNEE